MAVFPVPRRLSMRGIGSLIKQISENDKGAIFMGLTHRYHKNILIIDVVDGDGKLALQDIDVFINEVLSLYNGKGKEIAIDMSKKSYLNSSGLGDLIKIKDRFMDDGIVLVLIKPTARVLSLLEMVGVIQFFKIIEREDELG